MQPQQPQPPMSTTTPAALGPFTTLKGGGGGALAAGASSSPVMSLHVTGATWWTGDAATTISFPNAGPVHNSVWIDGGKRLRVGLGTIDVAAKSFAIEPALQQFANDINRVGGVAWFPDGTRVALLLNGPALRVDQRPPRDYDRNKRELVIASLAGTEPPIRRDITVAGTPVIAAGDDRIVVGGKTTQLFNGRGEPVDVAFTTLPEFVARASYGAGRFVLVGSDGTVTLLDAKSGAKVATWGGQGTQDAAATGTTVVAIGSDGTVRVGCLTGTTVTEVAKASAGAAATLVQLVGDRVVVSADGPDPIRVATLTSPCAP